MPRCQKTESLIMLAQPVKEHQILCLHLQTMYHRGGEEIFRDGEETIKHME